MKELWDRRSFLKTGAAAGTLWAMGQALTSHQEQTFYPSPASLSSFVFEGAASEKSEYGYYENEF